MDKTDLYGIKKEINKIKSVSFYTFIFIGFLSLGSFQIVQGFLHGINMLYIGIGGIWIVVGAAILIGGIMANYYKAIIKKLIKRIKENDKATE